jgi:hypothetical protein
MPEIRPKMSRKKLQKGARRTAQGKGRTPLPGVKTDSLHPRAVDKNAYAANRDLATLIRRAVRARKKTDKHGARFVLGWRLYPNEDHPSWKSKDVHACGCGCGCHA